LPILLAGLFDSFLLKIFFRYLFLGSVKIGSYLC